MIFRHLLSLWLAVILVAGAAGYAIYRGAEAQSHQNDALDAVMCRAEHVIRTTRGITAKQRRQGLRFYEQEISANHLKPCDH